MNTAQWIITIVMCSISFYTGCIVLTEGKGFQKIIGLLNALYITGFLFLLIYITCTDSNKQESAATPIQKEVAVDTVTVRISVATLAKMYKALENQPEHKAP